MNINPLFYKSAEVVLFVQEGLVYSIISDSTASEVALVQMFESHLLQQNLLYVKKTTHFEYIPR